MNRHTYKVEGTYPHEVGTVTDNRTGEVVKVFEGLGPGGITVEIACVNECRYQNGGFSPAAHKFWKEQREKCGAEYWEERRRAIHAAMTTPNDTKEGN